MTDKEDVYTTTETAERKRKREREKSTKEMKMKDTRFSRSLPSSNCLIDQADQHPHSLSLQKLICRRLIVVVEHKSEERNLH